MYYRRKLLLSLLEALNRPVGRTDLQKLLFLVCAEQESPSYEFVPYRFGCFSFQSMADKSAMTKYRLLADVDHWALAQKKSHASELTANDQLVVMNVVDQFGKMSTDQLLRHVYLTYPYYAIHSELLSQTLTGAQRKRVEAAKPLGHSARLFTIGYEGKTLENYINCLLREKVGLLCDVRRNPVSMKFGFNKRQLESALRGVGIAYAHLPELGIASNKRRALVGERNYQALFLEYERTTLKQNPDALDQIISMIGNHGRVALACFEADPTCCHRGRVAHALESRPDWRHRVLHI